MIRLEIAGKSTNRAQDFNRINRKPWHANPALFKMSPVRNLERPGSRILLYHHSAAASRNVNGSIDSCQEKFLIALCWRCLFFAP